MHIQCDSHASSIYLPGSSAKNARAHSHGRMICYGPQTTLWALISNYVWLFCGGMRNDTAVMDERAIISSVCTPDQWSLVVHSQVNPPSLSLCPRPLIFCPHPLPFVQTIPPLIIVDTDSVHRQLYAILMVFTFKSKNFVELFTSVSSNYVIMMLSVGSLMSILLVE